MLMRYWLRKSEPKVYSIDDLSRDKTTLWNCVRNYEARNNLKAMTKGDLLFFYHSNTEDPAIVGVAELADSAIAEEIQFNSKSDYFDPKSTRDNPRWFSPKIKFVRKLSQPITISEIKKIKELKKMRPLQKGSRLSVQVVSNDEGRFIINYADHKTSKTR